MNAIHHDPVSGMMRRYFWSPEDEGIAALATPLHWSDDDAENLRNLLEVSYANTVALAPEAQNVRYDFEHRHFVNRSGHRLVNADLDAIAARAAAGYSDRGLGELVGRGTARGAAARPRGLVGSATIKNAALYRSLVEQAGSPASRRLVLDQLVRQLRRDGVDPALEGIRYRRSGYAVARDWLAGQGQPGGKLAPRVQVKPGTPQEAQGKWRRVNHKNQGLVEPKLQGILPS